MSRWERAALLGAALVAGAVLWHAPPNEPALPEVVYDRGGVAYTQGGERVEEDSPLWDCETMGNRECGGINGD